MHQGACQKHSESHQIENQGFMSWLLDQLEVAPPLQRAGAKSSARGPLNQNASSLS